MSGQQADNSGGAAPADSTEPLRVIKNLLTSYHESNQAAGAQQLYDMAKDHAVEIVQSDLLPFLVIMLEAKTEATRAAAAAALAGLASVLEGRDAVRRCGALRPLTLLLKEGPVSRAAAQAARAIANAAASDVIKEALWEVGALPLLASLLRQGADARTGSLHAVQAAAASSPAAGGGGEEGAKQGPVMNAQTSLNAAAVFAVGALVNLVLHAKCAAALQQACPELPTLLQEVARGHAHDMLGQRCRLVLQLLAAGLGNQDFRVPGDTGAAERYLHQARRAGQLDISTGGVTPEAPPPLQEEASSTSTSSQLAAVLSQIGFKSKEDIAAEEEAAAAAAAAAAGGGGEGLIAAHKTGTLQAAGGAEA